MEKMAHDDAVSYITQAAALPRGGSSLCFSGGEVLLYREWVLELLNLRATSTFRFVSLITNGFWATSRRNALVVARELRQAGLTTLIVSASPFHAKYVSTDRARCALSAAEEVGLETYVKVTAPGRVQVSAEETLRSLGTLPETTQIDLMTLSPGGRAATLDEANFDLQKDLPRGRCPGKVLTIHPNGDAYFCCSPGSITPGLALGNAKEETIEQLVATSNFTGHLAFIRLRGPAAFSDALQNAGMSAKMDKGFASVCHLCTALVSDDDVLPVLRREGEAFVSNLMSHCFDSSFVAALHGSSDEVSSCETGQ